MPNCAGGMTIVQLGADLCNEGRADECRQVQTSADKCRQVQTSADKCRRKTRLSTLRNTLIINAVHTKSAECRVQTIYNINYWWAARVVKSEFFFITVR